MRDEQYEVSAFWGDRPETPESAAQRLGAMVEGLAALGAGFGDWVVGEDEPLPTGAALVDWLRPRFDPARTRRQPDIGAGFFLLSDQGLSDRVLEVQITCGVHAGMPVLKNHVHLVPRDAHAVEVLPASAPAVLAAVARAWDADWVAGTTDTLRSAVTAVLTRPVGPVPGRLTWLSGAFADPTAAVADTAQVTPAAGGWLVDAGPLADDPGQFAEVVAGWERAGALTPRGES